LAGLTLPWAVCAAAVVTTNLLLSGTRFATEVYRIQSDNPGPTVFICGGAHGNEPAGAIAAERIDHWPITQGGLIVVPRANVPALQAFKRYTPGLKTNVSNLNRNYPRAGKDEAPRGEQAEAIWKLVQETHPDWVLDLHEGYDFHQVNKKSVGSSIIPFTNQLAVAAADRMIAAVNRTIPDQDETVRFTRLGLPIDGSLARAVGEHLRVPAMIVETTFKLPLETRVQHHETVVHALLQHLGMMDTPPPAVALRGNEVRLTANSGGTSTIRVALYDGPGTGGQGPPNLMKRLNNAPHSTITAVSPDEIQSGVLTNFDVVIFAGGGGRDQATALGEHGRAEVCKFVADGGGYVGICAGAYLATSGFSWSLGLVNASTVSPKWQRGKGTVKLELTDAGARILGNREGLFDCRYVNGPIIKAGTIQDLPPYETLASFRSELAENGAPAGLMVDSPAIFVSAFQKGRVVCISPHPEQTTGLEDFVPRAVAWTVVKEVTYERNHGKKDIKAE
jgi:predicted deacylase